ncbi:hypothetical protein psyc5s11_42100 [Clostridium gelidum]|uniref:histidine kinase n=1 Tax=Clostridium gelidum TaxID=704125 RepID=A0ABM7T9Y9_9CLOT|nr:ATP-binding protein [Clostridium gelidum]BCZ48143.1 hypothetical protein psyc5s11_42100 [Clostridium gelidum]
MGKKLNKRSLQRRIKNMTFLLNLNSLLIMMLFMIFALGATFKIFSTIISEIAANQISFQLRDEYSKELHQGKIKAEFTEITDEYKEMFKRVGFSYVLHFNTESKIDISKKNHDDVKELANMPLLIVDYNILKDNKLIYSSVPEFVFDPVKLTSKDENWVTRILNTTTTTIVNDDEDKPLFTLQVNLNPKIIYGGYIALVAICSIIFLITLIISKITSYKLSTVIIKPLSDLNKIMKDLANGNIEEAIHTEIKFKKPISEVEELVKSTNIIMANMHDYVDILGNQKIELEAQNATLNENSRELENINQTLDNKNLKLKNILNNVEQGFFNLGQDLLIQEEYSLQCEKIFNSVISYKKLSSILYPKDDNMMKFIDELLVKIFEADISQRKLYLTLLPEEIAINDKVLSLCFKVAKDSKDEDIIMTIITDITEKRFLEKKMHEEQTILKMVVKAIINRDEFRELVNEYEEFTGTSFKNIPKEEHEHTFRQIHNFKGNFSQYEMVSLINKLNELENKLYEGNHKFHIEDIDGTELSAWLREDLDIIETYAGKDFMKYGELCYVRKEKLIEIENKIREVLPQNELKVILPLIRDLRSKSLKDLMRTYPDYVMKLSERLGKSVNPFEIVGDDIRIDASSYQDMLKAIVHIFRNSVDHGIETEDERLEAGKGQVGNITCRIRDLQDDFQIIISDDGRGINVKLLEQKSLDKGIYTEEELKKMNYEEKINLIFEQGITTKEEANNISGRGVGMSAVKQSVEECGGRIKVDNSEGYGTVFILTLPKLKDEDKDPITATDFIKEIAETSIDIIFKQTGLNFELREIQAKNIIALNEITAILSVSGTINCILTISVNNSMGKKLVEGFMIDDINEEDKTNYFEDVLGEISNTVIGLTSGKFDDENVIFHMGIPSMISNSIGGYIKNTQTQILCCNLICSEYEFNINMILDLEEINLNDLYGGNIDG